MVYQTTVQNTNSIHFGSAKVEAGPSVGSLVNIGLAAGIEFNEEFELIYLVPDNGARIAKGRKNHRAVIKFDMMELYMDNIYSLRGGADTKTPTAGSSTPVVDERHVLTGTTGCRFNFKNGANTICTSITVKNAAGDSGILGTDYVLYQDAAGYTCIARISGSTTIATGDNVKVSYTYTPNASVSLSSGGLTTITPQVVRLTNVDAAGKKFEVTVYSAISQKGISMKFPADDSEKSLVIPFELTGEVDISRTAGDQLFKILDEQGV
jgi:hypothetical protein